MDTRLLRLTTRDENGRRIIRFSSERHGEIAHVGVKSKGGSTRRDFPVNYVLMKDGRQVDETMYKAKDGLRGFFQRYPHLLPAFIDNGGVVV